MLALCLSGGGFRASLFHLGALRRLNELGILRQIDVITSVSGGSITNGVLALRWNFLLLDQSSGVFHGFDKNIATPLRRFCAKDLRTKLIVGTWINPSRWRYYWGPPRSLANQLAHAYSSDKDLQFSKMLRELPAPSSEKDGHAKVPRFVFCATNLQSGGCWQFHCGPDARMGDFPTGYRQTGEVCLGDAVAASSAFPPAFPPFWLKTDGKYDRLDPWGEERQQPPVRLAVQDHQKKLIALTDGGIYDNHGLEPVWKRTNQLLVSDGGLPFTSIGRANAGFAGRMIRCFDISWNQDHALRRRWLMDRFLVEQGKKQSAGTFWGISTNFRDYQLNDGVGFEGKALDLLQRVRTDLNAFSEAEQGCLENHGYYLADNAIRQWVPELLPKTLPNLEPPWPQLTDSNAVCRSLVESHKRKIARDVWSFIQGL